MSDGDAGRSDDERVGELYQRAVRWSWGFVGVALAGAIIVFVLGYFSPLVVPLVLSVFVAVVFAPAVSWLAGRGVPRALGALAVLLVVAVAFVGSIAAVVVGIVDQADNLRARFDDVVAEIDALLEQSDLSEFVDSVLDNVQSSGGFAGGGVATTVGSAFSTASGFVSGLLLGIVITYYLLKDGPSLVEAIVRARRPATAARVGHVVDEAARDLRTYMKGRTILALVQGVVIGVVATVAGVPLAFTIAIVNVIGGYVPYLGGFVGGAFAFLMALSEGGLTLGLVMLVAVVAVSVGLENLLEPAIVGNQLEMHPIVVLLATFTGGMLVGLTGLVLAAPTVAITRRVYRELVRPSPGAGPSASGATVDTSVDGTADPTP